MITHLPKPLVLMLTLGFVSLVSCTTFKKRQCENMDWELQGRLNALAGSTLNQGLVYYNKECWETHGVSLNHELYQKGFDSGLKEFCTPEFAYQFGSNGGLYRGTCPEEAEKALMPRYSDGRAMYTNRRMVELESEVARLRNRNSFLESDLTSCRANLNTCNAKAASCR